MITLKNSTKKALVAVGVTALGAAAVGVIYKLTSKFLMKVAFERELPKAVADRQVDFIAENDISDILEQVRINAEKLEARPLETVELTATDGTKLIGHWLDNSNAKRIIIAMHGWRSGWSQDFGSIADFWFDSGCSILFAEQRGQGSSGGDYMGFGLLERHDCLEWINWVNQKTESNLPLYLGGISMGASTVMMTLGLEVPKNLRGVIADCGFTSPRAIWRHVIHNKFHLPFGIYGAVADDMCKKKLMINSNECTCPDVLSETKIPVLFIHGTDDKFVPIEMTYENYKACASEKQLLVVPGAEHGMSYFVDRKAYESAVTDFFNTYDN